MEKVGLTAKHSSLAFVLGFIFCQLALAVFSLIGLSVNQIISGNSEWFSAFIDSNAWGLFVQTIIMELVFTAIFIFFNNKAEERSIDKPQPRKMLIYLAFGVASFFCLYPIITCVNTALNNWGVKLVGGVDITTKKDFVLGIFSLALLPAIGEELLFRGVILRGFKRYGKAASIILTTLCFAVFHMSAYQLVYPVLFGLLLGGIMYKENNIIYTMAVHFVNNFLALLVNYLNLPLAYKHFSYIILAIVLLAVYLTIILLYIFKGNKGSKIQSFGKEKYWVVGAFIIMILFWILVSVTA